MNTLLFFSILLYFLGLVTLASTGCIDALGCPAWREQT